MDVALVLAGLSAWGAYSVRVLLRGLHMLQLEGYETRRFLTWSARNVERWLRPDQARLSLLGVALAGIRLCLPRVARFVSLGWAGLGLSLWRDSQFAAAKKPFVLTSRAKRLLAGQVVVAAGAGLLPSALIRLIKHRRMRRTTALYLAVSCVPLLAPLITATANLLLWPIEEWLRRYYLRDAEKRLLDFAPTVIGIAGSYGKTSTKEFLATILGSRWSVLKPPGSFNTPMGLSRVIREQLQVEHEVFVAELGDYVPGDIRFLCDLVHPRIGVLTTIGPEHLERFKTMERIVEAKAELVDALPTDGVAVVNQDDLLVRGLGDGAEHRGLRVVRYGYDAAAQVRASKVRTTREGLVFKVVARGSEETFRVGVLGRHNVANVLAATAVALELGMTLREIAAAAVRIAPVEHRLQPIKGKGNVLVIDDAFNSNPVGAAEALSVLSELEGGRRLLVTPGMVELAEREFEENRTFGRKAAEVCDEVILVGTGRAEPLLTGLREAGFPEAHTHVVRDLDSATSRLESLVKPGDIVLFENDLPDTYEEQSLINGQQAPNRGISVDTSSPQPNGQHPIASPTFVVTSTNATQQFMSVDGLRIAYRDSGSPREGSDVVVVLHGWGASAAAVESVQQCLRDEYRVVAPDLPGFGASDAPSVTWGSDEYAAALKMFLAKLGIERATFIGHSLGGKLSIMLAATAPQLVDRLILVDSAGIRASHGPKYQAKVFAFKTARRVLGLPWLHGNRAVQDWAFQQFGSDDYRAAGSLRSTLVRLVNEDVRGVLSEIHAPTLIIWGDEDEATPLRDGRLMQQLIPNSGLVAFSGAGHFSYADDPGRFCRTVTFFLQSPR